MAVKMSKVEASPSTSVKFLSHNSHILLCLYFRYFSFRRFYIVLTSEWSEYFFNDLCFNEILNCLNFLSLWKYLHIKRKIFMEWFVCNYLFISGLIGYNEETSEKTVKIKVFSLFMAICIIKRAMTTYNQRRDRP